MSISKKKMKVMKKIKWFPKWCLIEEQKPFSKSKYKNLLMKIMKKLLIQSKNQMKISNWCMKMIWFLY